MAKRGSFTRLLKELERAERRNQQEYQRRQRETARRQREAEKQEREAIRLQERAFKEAEQAAKKADKIAQQKYIESRLQHVELVNREHAQQLIDLQTLLEVGLKESFDFDKIITSLDTTTIPPHPGNEPQRPNPERFKPIIPQESFTQKLGLGRAKRQTAIEEIIKEAKQKYARAVAEYEVKHANYSVNLEAHLNAVQERQDNIEDLKRQYAEKNPIIIKAYYSQVLEQAKYPAGFPQYGAISYNPETSELIVEYELPAYDDIMPALKGYKYIKQRDEIQEIALTKTDEKQMQALYEDVIAAIALRVIYTVFRADESDVVDSVVFNGVVFTVDKATGQPATPCLVSVQASLDVFSQLNLTQVDKKACLKFLKAQTSPSSKELVPIKPIVDLPKEDSRFVEEIDVISGLDSRPNLMEMTPGEFEHLIANLFSRIEGLTTNTTTISRDGGVDVIAYDNRPILGGKVIIQAKRYKNTVGVESVRALYGVMQDEGATKGILVATSSFGTASREFAKGKPIELIDGNGLLYLLQENGFEAKIEIME